MAQLPEFIDGRPVGVSDEAWEKIHEIMAQAALRIAKEIQQKEELEKARENKDPVKQNNIKVSEQDKRYIPPQEFAEMFGIHRRTVYRRIDEIKKGIRNPIDMPFIQIGGKGGPIRIDLNKYIDMNTTDPKEGR